MRYHQRGHANVAGASRDACLSRMILERPLISPGGGPRGARGRGSWALIVAQLSSRLRPRTESPPRPWELEGGGFVRRSPQTLSAARMKAGVVSEEPALEISLLRGSGGRETKKEVKPF